MLVLMPCLLVMTFYRFSGGKQDLIVVELEMPLISSLQELKSHLKLSRDNG
ncbi:hypothetical protein METHB2_40013 [Candidatus Methylobacter favarea]|uniref:Uncharacterized protein n=1 Tax=Candidatus Methylobacter favarea TaxID=2707345 RepID=A0A8S0Y6G1_9GAMM|nr:hypothetical protein METHB2_40013 [Candidatus Methylobacter favarea]